MLARFVEREEVECLTTCQQQSVGFFRSSELLTLLRVSDKQPSWGPVLDTDCWSETLVKNPEAGYRVWRDELSTSARYDVQGRLAFDGILVG